MLCWYDFLGDGFLVVFIYGFGCVLFYDYFCIVSDFVFCEWCKIFIDLLGFGYSDKLCVFSYNIYEQVLVLEQFFSYLCLQCFVLFGYSMGGSIVIEVVGLLGEWVIMLLVLEFNLFVGGGEYSRCIVVQLEIVFVVDGYVRLLVEECLLWVGCL